MRDALYIAAKAPRAGFAKTRLGREIGHERAVAFYAAFLSDLAARFADAPFPLVWYVTPSDAWADVAPLVGAEAEQPDRVLDQGEGDWAERQGRLFRGAEARGEERVVLMASDSPHLPVAVVEGAFRELRRHDLVLGPVHDGGYYLVGMCPSAARHDVLGVPMSTATVLGDVVARAESLGLSVGRVAPTFDVDEAEDLERLRPLALACDDLPATRAAFSEASGPPARAIPEENHALQEV
ncbi:DUF2064 domain-containing protein [Rubrobacter marinus]|uniref:DUF2064 domain-containing protein n=1 Tax=Rubrobacter marinus TaxID=2653852 RepID=A0A6G8PSJ4_9ACTN|nr:TIGR04282 family arsenosugar biosynthesis glycosyltransferase [Rubrobacter marinus]QIN77468.1 DUF2064 domain-containing protein [Rubrobacter marinus]